MHPGVKVERLEPHRDARGWVIEPISPALIPAQKNVHIATVEPGHVRANHYHTSGTEILVLQGPALVRIREGEKLHDLEVPEGELYRLTIPAGVPHALQNTGPGTILVVGFNTTAHDPANPTEVRDVLIPFKRAE